MIETTQNDAFDLEISQNERSKDDRVYFCIEKNYDLIYEDYLTVDQFKSLLKTMVRADEKLIS